MASKRDVENIIQKLININPGRFPKIKEIAKALDANVFQTQKMLKTLVEDNFLVRQGNWYRLNPVYESVPSAVPKKYRLESQTKRKIKKRKLRKRKAPAGTGPIIFLRLIMTFIGIGAVMVSIYYTYIWLASNLPWPLAGILSLIMVGFSVFAFEIMLLFISKTITIKWWRWLVVLGFLGLWAIVSAFSIASTIAGQYNRYVVLLEAHIEKTQSVTVDRTKWGLLRDQKAEKKLQIEEKRQQLRQLIKLSASIQDTRDVNNTWNNAQWKIRTLNQEISELSKSLDQLLAIELSMLDSSPRATTIDTTTGKIPDFYGWLAGVIKRDKDIVQFWVTLAPAVFVDLIAPVAFAIGLFLRRRKQVGIGKEGK